MNVVYSISYKNIIQTDHVNSSGKYSIGSSNTLELKFVNNSGQYEKYILARWARYKSSMGEDVDDDTYLDPSNFV